MAEIRKAMQQLSQLWQEMSAKQRFLLTGGAALTLAVLLIFVRQLASPNNKVLFSGLSPADAQSIAAQLAAKNIPHQLDPAGPEISVPADQLDAARLEVASQGMPHSGRMGFEIFDKVSWGQTEFDEKVNSSSPRSMAMGRRGGQSGTVSLRPSLWWPPLPLRWQFRRPPSTRIKRPLQLSLSL